MATDAYGDKIKKKIKTTLEWKDGKLTEWRRKESVAPPSDLYRKNLGEILANKESKKDGNRESTRSSKK